MNAPNKVNQHQRAYQHAYKAHTRIWRIVSRRLNIQETWEGRRRTEGDGWMDGWMDEQRKEMRKKRMGMRGHAADDAAI
jgi:hypothetical protein